MKPLHELPPNWKQRLGQDVDRVIAEEFGISHQDAFNLRRAYGIPPKRTNRATPEIIALLGKIPDKEIAIRFDASATSVRTWRIQRGIPAVRRPLKQLPPKILRMLGKKPLRVISEEAGVSKERVRQWMLQRGIPPRKQGCHGRRSA